VTGTLAETAPDREARPPRPLLVYVLNYDDLLRDDGAVFGLDRTLSIGRGEVDRVTLRGSQLAIPDPRASSEHVRLERRGGGFVVVDLGSRNGTRVNGQPAQSHRLLDRDLIEIGRSLFVYREVADELADAMLARDHRLGPTVTRSPETIALVRDLDRIAPTKEPVLVLAETGAGKEIVCGELHARSGRRGPLRAVDCGAIPESLFESTLFGHRKGAFTGAAETRTGEIVRSSGGTLFLDEVGNLPASAQAKLLRVLETAEVTPVGGDRPRRVDLRCVAATNADLFATATAFREDLVRRLAGWIARIPPLRERREDLGALSAHLLRDAGVSRASIRPEAARALFTGRFPGNIRELRAVLRSAALLAGDGPIELSHLPPGEVEAAPPSDRDALAAALTAARGNVSAAARSLGTHPRQVYRWVDKYGLDLEHYRS